MNKVWIRRCLTIGGATMVAACSACWVVPLLGMLGLGGLAMGALGTEFAAGALVLVLAMAIAVVVKRLKSKPTSGCCRGRAEPSSPVDAPRRSY